MPLNRGKKHYFQKISPHSCILQFCGLVYFGEWPVFVAKIQKINLIGCHLMLKSVNFFIFHFQILNILGRFEALLIGELRGTICKKRQFWQMFTSV
jgi:hypothetical protein